FPFQPVNDLTGSLHNRGRNPSQTCNFNPIRLTGHSGLDSVKEDDSSRGFLDGDAVVPDSRVMFLQTRQFLIVGGKQGTSLPVGLLNQILCHRPGDGETIKSGGSTPDFVQQDETSGSRGI